MPSLRCVGTLSGNQHTTSKHYPVASGVTVNEGDFVYFASGRITSASIAGARLAGVVETGGSVTGNAGGTVTAMVNVSPDSLYVVTHDNVGTTASAAHVGTYFDLVGATGAQLADTSTTGTSGQLLLLEHAPDVAQGDATKGVFMIAEHFSKI